MDDRSLGIAERRRIGRPIIFNALAARRYGRVTHKAAEQHQKLGAVVTEGHRKPLAQCLFRSEGMVKAALDLGAE